MQCPMCGAYSPTDAKVCYRCSFVYVSSQPNPAAKNPTTQTVAAAPIHNEPNTNVETSITPQVPQHEQQAPRTPYTQATNPAIAPQQKSKRGLIIGLIVVLSLLTIAISTVAAIMLFGDNRHETSTGSQTAISNDLQPIEVGRFPFTSSRQITDSDLYGLTAYDLRIMRNEIYARRGFIFGKQDLIRHFSQQSWYQPLYNEVTLSTIEAHNVRVIVAYENRLKSTINTNKNVGRYPYTSTQKLTESDLEYLSSYDLRIMRNEIYARNGYIFDNDELRNYFSQQSWYQPYTYNPTLNSIEQYNIMFIKNYENGSNPDSY